MQNITSVLSGFLAAALLTAVAQAQTYNVTIINPPSGTTTCVGDSINAMGQAVGYTTVKVGKSTVLGPAFFWDRGQSSTLAPLSGQASAEATRISDSGLIVGGPNLQSSLDTGRATWWENTPSGYQAQDWNSLLQPGTGLTLLRADSLSDDGRYVSFQANVGSSGLRD